MQNDQSGAGPRSTQDKRPLVYVVDDEPLVLELAATLLAALGCRVETYLDGEKALAAFVAANALPALIITDYAMHRMNGMEFIEQCRRLQPRQKIILTSGTVDESIYGNSAVRPDRFLAKPYQARRFAELVETLLGDAGGPED